MGAVENFDALVSQIPLPPTRPELPAAAPKVQPVPLPRLSPLDQFDESVKALGQPAPVPPISAGATPAPAPTPPLPAPAVPPLQSEVEAAAAPPAVPMSAADKFSAMVAPRASSQDPNKASFYENVKAGLQGGLQNIDEMTGLSGPVLNAQLEALGLTTSDNKALAEAAAPIRAAGKLRAATGVKPAEGWTVAHAEQMLGGALPSLGVVGAAAGVGSLLGPAGTIAGLAGSSAMLTNASAFFDYLDMKGIDTSNAVAVEAALTVNPDLKAQAAAYAGVRSGISGVINAVSGKAGGMVSDRFLSAGATLEGALSGPALKAAQQAGVKASTGARVAGGAADVGIGSGAAGIQEAANQLQDTGKLDFNKIAQQAVLGTVTYAPFVAYAGGKLATKSAARGLVKAGQYAFGGEKPIPHTVPDPANPAQVILNPELYPLTNDQNDLAGIDIASNLISGHATIRAGRSGGAVGDPKIGRNLLDTKLEVDAWMQDLTNRVDPATKSTQVWDQLMRRMQRLPQKQLLRIEEMLQIVADSRIIVNEVPNAANANLMPDLHIHTPGGAVQRPDLELKVSASTEKSSGKTALTIDDASRALYPSEVKRLLDYAQSKGYAYISWEKDSKHGYSLFNEMGAGAPLSDLTRALVPQGGQKDIKHMIAKTQRLVPTQLTSYWTPLSQNPMIPRNRARLHPIEQSLEYRHSPEELKPTFTKMAQIIQTLAKAAGLSKPLHFRDSTNEGVNANWGGAAEQGNRYVIGLALGKHKSVSQAYATAIHELGHVIFYDKFRSADPRLMLAILGEYHQWRDDIAALASQGAGRDVPAMTKEALQYILSIREDPQSLLTGPFMTGKGMAKYNSYWHSFGEFMADRVARWGTTNLRPISVVDKFFKGLGRSLFNTARRFEKVVGMKVSPEPLIADWLNTLTRSIDAGAFASLYQKMAIQSMLANHQAMKSMGAEEVDAVPETSSTSALRIMKMNIFSGKDTARWKRKPAPTDGNGNPLPPDSGGWVPKSGGVEKNYDGMMAFADRMNVFLMNTIGIHQAAAANPHIRELVLYKDTLQQAELEKATIIAERMKTLQKWPKGKAQNQALIKAMDDMGQMRYRSQQEIDSGIRRQPTQAERDSITRELTPATKEVFEQVLKDYDSHLEMMAELLRTEAAKKTNLVGQAQRLVSIDAMVKKMRKAPYVPQVRFGRYTIRVLDRSTKEMIHFMTAETKGERRRAVSELNGMYPPGTHEIKQGQLAEDSIPLLGMPPDFLKMINEKLALSPTQKAAVRDLQYEMAPAQSFKHRLQSKDNVPGYSMDFKRAYADYFTHGVNFLARVKYRDQLQSLIHSVFEQAQIPDFGDKRMQIHNMMSRHYGDWVDPKPDFWRLKAAAFFIHLGYNPASALVNLTQIPLQTAPFLMRGFSDPLAMRYILKAGADISTYYRRATLEHLTDDHIAMLNELVQEGILTEAMAPQFAAIAEGRNMTERYLGNAAQRGTAWFLHHSGTLFQLAEQMNRRITASATYKLAIDYPGAKLVREAMENNPQQFARLIERGHSPAQARAITAAKYAVENTQGVYSRWARPAMFRGKLGSLFLFKSFQQNLLFSMWNYPAAGVKTALAMMLLGGAMGIPGVPDVSDMIKAIGGYLEKDWDVERHARELVMDLSDGTIPPDILLHGTSKYGFGVPAILDLIGHTAQLGDVPFPTVDMSGSVGFGNISPVQMAPLFTSVSDPNAVIGQASQQASGAAFSLGFAMYKAISDPTNMRAWSQLVPRAAYNLWRAYQSSQDKLVNASGARVVKFDPSDTRQMMEVLAMSGGFMPLRLTAEWDREKAVKEVLAFWNLRREGLLRQFGAAIVTADPDERTRVLAAIRQFNSQLPPGAGMKKISADTIKSSVEARMKSVRAQEQQRAISKQDIGIVRGVNKLYPEAKDVVASQKLAPSKVIVSPTVPKLE